MSESSVLRTVLRSYLCFRNGIGLFSAISRPPSRQRSLHLGAQSEITIVMEFEPRTHRDMHRTADLIRARATLNRLSKQRSEGLNIAEFSLSNVMVRFPLEGNPPRKSIGPDLYARNGNSSLPVDRHSVRVVNIPCRRSGTARRDAARRHGMIRRENHSLLSSECFCIKNQIKY